MKKLVTGALVAVCALGLVSVAGAQVPQLNEIARNDDSTDDWEFIEICGDPDSDLSAFTIIEIEGDGGGNVGVIDKAIGLSGLIGASGFYTVGQSNVTCADQIETLNIENGGVTILLVRNFTGAVGMDLDTDDDCVADGPFPGMIVDGVGMGRPSQGDCITYYGVQGLGPDTGADGTADFDPAGVARCADCNGDWGMICLAGIEPPQENCLAANPDNLYNVATATPCGGNACSPVSVDEASWGQIKGSYKGTE